MKNYQFLIPALLLCVVACGGGSGTSPGQPAGTGGSLTADPVVNPAPTPITINGVAIDGYLKGARAFLDLNDDGNYQDGEPMAMTDSAGGFALSATAAQIAAHSVVVSAIAGQTVDQDTPGVALTKSFTMLAPPGKPEVVSPITTSVVAKVAAGQTLSQAETAVKSDLGLAAVDVYKNYVSAKASNPDYQKMHNIASAMAEVAKTVEASNPAFTRSQKLQQVSSSVSTEVLTRLPAIKEALDANAAKTVIVGSVSVSALQLYAAAANLTSQLDMASNTLTLRWNDSFPVPTRYDIKSQNADGSFTLLESVMGALGSNSVLSWQRVLTSNAVYRVEAVASSTSVTLMTPQKQSTVAGTVPTSTPTIELSVDEPASGSVQLSIGGGLAYQSVAWYSDLRLIGTSTSGVGNPLTWNTSTETNNTHLVMAKIQLATDSFTEVRRNISVANSNLALSATVNGTTGTINIDVSASSEYGVARVEAAFDGATATSLTEPNACSRYCNGNNLFRFNVNAATAGSGSHSMVITAIDKKGARKSQTVQVPIANLPLLTLSSPGDGALVNGILRVSGTNTSDKAGAVTVTASLRDYQFLSTTDSSFTGTMDLTSLAAGPYTLTLRATDSSKAVTVLQRTISVTSSAALAYTPLFDLGAGGQLLAAKDDHLLYRSASGSISLRNESAGTEVVLSGDAAATRYLQDWQISNGYVYANGKGSDCPKACVYQWLPQGTMRNLSSTNPFSVSPSDMGGRAYDRYAVAHDGFVIWVNDQANTAPQLGGAGWYTLYDIAKGTASKISAPAGSRFVGNNGYDFFVEANGTLSFYYWARYGFVDISAIFDVYRWSSDTNTSTKLISGTTIRPKTDRARWIWQQPASGGTGASTLLSQPLNGGASTTLTSSAGNYLSRDGVTAWLETSTSTSSGRLGGTATTVTGLKAISGNDEVSTISSLAGVNLYAVGGGQVVFGEAGKIYSWNASTKKSSLRLETAPSQVMVSASTMYFVMGSAQKVYKLALD
jgi:hypothetical protein